MLRKKMFRLCLQVLVVLFAQDFPKRKNVERTCRWSKRCTFYGILKYCAKTLDLSFLSRNKKATRVIKRKIKTAIPFLPYFPVYGFRYISDPSSHTISCHKGWISQSSKKSTKFKFRKFNFNMFQFWNFWINSHVFTKFKTICFFNCQRRTSE